MQKSLIAELPMREETRRKGAEFSRMLLRIAAMHPYERSRKRERLLIREQAPEQECAALGLPS